MMQGEPTILAVVGIMGSMVAVLVWLIKKQFAQNDTTIKESNRASILLADSINKLSMASERQVAAIDASREENRNFQKLVVSKLDNITAKADRNYSAIKKQTVKEQTVEHQTIKSQD